MSRRRGSRKGGRAAAKKAEKRPTKKLAVAVVLVMAVAAVVAFAVFGRGNARISGPSVSTTERRTAGAKNRGSDSARASVPMVGYTPDGTPEFSFLRSEDGQLTKVFHHYWLTGKELPEEQVHLVRDWQDHAWSLIKRSNGLTPLATEVNEKIGRLSVGLAGPGNIVVLVADRQPWNSSCQEFPARVVLDVLPPSQLGVDWSRPQRSFPLPRLLPSRNFISLPSYRMTDALLSAVLIHELGHFIRYQERGCREWSEENGRSLEEVETHAAGGEILDHYSSGELDRMIHYVLGRVPLNADLEQTIDACNHYDWRRFGALTASRDFGIDRGFLTTQFYLSAYFAVVDRRDGSREEKAAAYRLVVEGVGQ